MMLKEIGQSITGWSFSLGVKRSSFSTKTFITKNSSDSAQIEIINTSLGQIRVHFIPTDTVALIDEFLGLYDLQATDSNSKVRTVLFGRFRVLVDFAP